MNAKTVTHGEFNQFAESMKLLLAEMVKEQKAQGERQDKIHEYMIHNDYRHADTDKRLTAQALEAQKDRDSIAEILEIVSKQTPFFNFLRWGTKTGKAIILAFVIAVAASIGTSSYEAIANKAKPTASKQAVKTDGE